jgi:valyl-tRNA synthetase
VDLWLLSKLHRLIADVTDSMDRHQFDEACKAIRGFAWETLADNYIELAKSRLYGDDEAGKAAARYTLYTALDALTRMLAPFAPFFAEEVYSHIGTGSVHVQQWPQADTALISDGAEQQGELIKEIAGGIRRYKSDNGIALNAPLSKIEIYGDFGDITDLAGVTNSPVEVMAGKPEFGHVAKEAKPDMGVIGPKFRKDAGKIIGALKALDPADVAGMIETGRVTVSVGDETFELEPEAVKVEKEVTSAGRAVDVLEFGRMIVVIVR